jgi:acyl carrier protein
MELNELYEKLTDIFRECFDDDDIVATPELTADDVDEWDSLAHVRLILAIGRSFNIRFSASEVSNFKNVGELAVTIQAKLP